jgi:hypothetical protein
MGTTKDDDDQNLPNKHESYNGVGGWTAWIISSMDMSIDVSRGTSLF